MAKVMKTKNNKKFVLLNPAEKATRFSRQLNSGVIRETGEVLDPVKRAFRVGYLQARNDNAKAYNSKNRPKK